MIQKPQSGSPFVDKFGVIAKGWSQWVENISRIASKVITTDSVHNDISGRDAVNCHPINSITDLSSTINTLEATDLANTTATATAQATASTALTTANQASNNANDALSIGNANTSQISNLGNALHIVDTDLDTLETLVDLKLDSVVAGTNITIDNTDPQNPVINADDSAVTSVNGQTGDVTLDAGDVGALPSGGTAVDSDKLEGHDSTYFAVAGSAPTAHHASHEVGGGDAITLAQSQITNLTTDLSGKLGLHATADDSAKLNGQLASYYATASDAVSKSTASDQTITSAITVTGAFTTTASATLKHSGTTRIETTTTGAKVTGLLDLPSATTLGDALKIGGQASLYWGGAVLEIDKPIGVSDTVYAQNHATTHQDLTITAGATTWDISAGGKAAFLTQVSANTTVTLTNLKSNVVIYLVFKQDATTPRTIILSKTGVTFALMGTTTSGANSLTIPTAMIPTAGTFYQLILNWASNSVCFVSVQK